MRKSNAVAAVIAVLAWLVPSLASAATGPQPDPGGASPSGLSPSGLSQSVGAMPIGTTAYVIPGGAFFVSVTSGSDAARGTLSAPWKTISHAISAAPSGSTLVIRAGVYREGLTINGKRLTLQPYPNEAVFVRGSNVVTSWVASAGVWRRDGWSYQFPRQMPILVLASHPMANAPDMVFYDSQPLRQVAKITQVKGKAFYVDYATSQLTIGVDPAGHLVEGATKSVGLSLVNADGSIIRGLQFEHFATSANSHGAVIDQSTGVTYENDLFIDNAMAGLSLRGSFSEVHNSTFSDNGQLGVHTFQADHVHVADSLIHHNNTEHFDQFAEAGGAKVVSTTNATFERNYVDNNVGNGIWYDIDANSAIIVHNELFSNSRNGIQYEISSGGVIAGNVARNNDDAGIYVVESSNVQVFNNVMFKNDVGLAVWEGIRPPAVANVVIRNNVVMDGRASSTTMLDVDDTTHRLSAAQMGVSTNFNAYCRSSSGTPARVVDWAQANSSQAHYASVPAYRAATGNELSGYSCEGAVATAFFVKVTAGNFALTSTSIGHNAGGALPTNVAAALGVTAGVPVDLGVI